MEIAMKKALITGITGQDGSYLAEFLLEKARVSVNDGAAFGNAYGSLSASILR